MGFSVLLKGIKEIQLSNVQQSPIILSLSISFSASNICKMLMLCVHFCRPHSLCWSRETCTQETHASCQRCHTTVGWEWGTSGSSCRWRGRRPAPWGPLGGLRPGPAHGLQQGGGEAAMSLENSATQKQHENTNKHKCRQKTKINTK